MTVVSFTKNELLSALNNSQPYSFSAGIKVKISDFSFSSSAQINSQNIIQELGNLFKQCNTCLSPIPYEAIHVETTSPLCFRVLVPFTLYSVNRTNWLSPPFNRLGVRNIAVTHDVHTISRGSGPISPLIRSESSEKVWQLSSEAIEEVIYRSHDGTDRNFREMLEKTHTDGIVILQNGKLIYEKYFNGQNQNTPHIQFSVTKSLVGLLTTQLIVDKVIDPQKYIREYIPELKESGFGDARVIEVLHMTTSLKYTEEYENPESDVIRHMFAAGYLSQPPEYSYEKTSRVFLRTIRKEKEHQQRFKYVSANSEILSWLVEKATELAGHKKTVNELFTQYVWSRLGVEHDAMIIKDSAGDASWAGGFNATTRDMARVGQMILNQGKSGNKQLISSSVFEFMRLSDMRPQFAASEVPQTTPAMKGWSYANQFWWTHNEHGAFTALGIYGQLLYIDPKTQMIIAKNSSHTEAEGNWLEHDVFVAAHALSKHLKANTMRAKL